MAYTKEIIQMSDIGLVGQEVKSNISFVNTINQEQTEMLRIGPDGFYVRGKKVPVDENEGLAVFKALKRFLVESELRRPYL